MKPVFFSSLTAPSPLTAGFEGQPFDGPLKCPKDLLRVFLFALVVMNVSRIHQHYPWLGVLRPALVLVGLVTGLALLRKRFFEGAPGTSTWIARVLGALAVVACLSALFGISFGATAKWIIDEYWKVLFVALLLIASIRTPSDLWFFAWAYVVGCAILVYLALFVFMPSSAGSDILRLQDLYKYDGNDVCVVLLIGLPLALLLLQVARTTWAKIVAMAVIVGLAVVVAKTGSRGGFVGSVAVFVALLVGATEVNLTRRLSFLVGLAVSLALGAPPGYWKQMRTVLKPTEDYNWNSEGGRKQIWMRGLSYMQAYPVFGVGAGNFGRAEGMISERAQRHTPDQPGIRWAAPHNSFVQAGAEMGVTGLALFSWIVVGGTVLMMRLRRRIPKEWARGSPQQRFMRLAPAYFAIAMLGFATSAFFVSHVYEDHFYFLVSLMAGFSGLLYSSGQLRRKGQTTGRRRQSQGDLVPVSPPAVS